MKLQLAMCRTLACQTYFDEINMVLLARQTYFDQIKTAPLTGQTYFDEIKMAHLNTGET
jgi:hypothetical protein